MARPRAQGQAERLRRDYLVPTLVLSEIAAGSRTERARGQRTEREDRRSKDCRLKTEREDRQTVMRQTEPDAGRIPRGNDPPGSRDAGAIGTNSHIKMYHYSPIIFDLFYS